jgi:hypothetical protein
MTRMTHTNVAIVRGCHAARLEVLSRERQMHDIWAGEEATQRFETFGSSNVRTLP